MTLRSGSLIESVNRIARLRFAGLHGKIAKYGVPIIKDNRREFIKGGECVNITQKKYCMYTDFTRVSEFLQNNFNGYPYNGSCEQPFWEKIHGSLFLSFLKTYKFNLWEDAGEIVGIAFFDQDVGEIFMDTKNDYRFLKQEFMVDYAERELFCIADDGARQLGIYCDDKEAEFHSYLKKKGYCMEEAFDNMVFYYNKGFPDFALPDGYKIMPSSNDVDFKRLAEMQWRGFGITPPGNSVDGMNMVINLPNYHHDLATIIVAPNGDYACYALLWVDEMNKFAYLEPLVTDEKYRGLGLASIALTESMKQSMSYGASFCVGASLPFYRKYGFEAFGGFEYWVRKWH